MQNLKEIFVAEMRRSGLRLTENRLAIFKVLVEAKKPLSIQEIILAVGDGTHFTTVYRSIEAMAEVKILRTVSRGFKNLYELGEKFKPHHHHATCEKCGRTMEIHDPRLEKLMLELTMRAGLKPTTHQFELFGICRKCMKNMVK
ncbi:MAG: transcriptional repressor [Candidatus Nomurabacteria bacterium]|jgi:Fe2+ or Zn2+ uptake regulation protein|nr:transcriptional repressor [Candidatus Nomurabacteria bacterium]